MRACRTPGSPDLRRTTATQRNGSRSRLWWSTAGMADRSRRPSRGRLWMRRGSWESSKDIEPMRIAELIERFGRSVFEAPFGAMAQTIGESPEVAEIRIALLDEVKRKIQRAGGKALFPYNVVRIGIRSGEQDAGVFSAISSADSSK